MAGGTVAIIAVIGIFVAACGGGSSSEAHPNSESRATPQALPTDASVHTKGGWQASVIRGRPQMGMTHTWHRARYVASERPAGWPAAPIWQA